MIHGKDIIIIANLGGTRQAVAACKSCGLNLDQSFIEACSPIDGRVTQKIPTKYDWSMDFSCLMAQSNYAKMLVDAVKNGTTFTAEFVCAGFKRKGTVLVKSCKIQGDVGGLAQMSGSFQGSGPILDGDADGWDYHAGNLYTYSPYANNAITVDGTVTSNALQHNTPS